MPELRTLICEEVNVTALLSNRNAEFTVEFVSRVAGNCVTDLLARFGNGTEYEGVYERRNSPMNFSTAAFGRKLTRVSRKAVKRWAACNRHSCRCV
ncbi:hypothetical protein PUN28_019963 [Cardiocondyla obscurior]|uniref:Uncharacterized protein n=1 Tax=Cardiocondyla obscurior TaxID=286306 RepID=A0AAW2E905_9HYME